MVRRPCAALVAAAFLLAGARGAHAHERSTSYSTWQLQDDGARVTLRIDERELTRLEESALPAGSRETRVALAIAKALRARRGAVPCTAAQPSVRLETAEGRAVLQWQIRCDAAGGWEIESVLPQALGVPHLHFARIVEPDGRILEALLHAERPGWREHAPVASDPASVFGRALSLGLEHIVTGYDHLAFLLGLLITATTLRQVALLVTAFTAAHSLTLALATLGLVRPPGVTIEILIAASIAVLAIENLTLAGRGGSKGGIAAIAVLLVPAFLLAASGLEPVSATVLAGFGLFSTCHVQLAERSRAGTQLRWLVAFVFGLLHGFGFAGALADAQYSGLPLAATLLGFNLGVEAGQIAIVMAIWPLLLLVRRRSVDHYESTIVEPASTALLAAATYWYLTRLYG